MTKPLVTAMACMTISTTKPSELVDLIRSGFGWEIASQGTIGTVLENAWGIVPGSAGTSWTLLTSPGSSRGMIRVVGGVDRWPSRSVGARWSGVEIVVMNDIDGLHERLAARPDWRVTKKPRNADFSDEGANVHRFFFGRGPGGTHFMFTMAVTAARDYDFPVAPAPVGYIFSIPLVSTDYGLTQRFYRDTLRMVPALTARLNEGLWHESWDLAAGTPVDLEILRGDAPGLGLGHVELQGYPVECVDPTPWVMDRLDGGACLGTYIVDDIDAAHRAVQADATVRLCSEPRPIAGAPYHGGRAFAVVSPTGERLELCERFTP